MITKKQWVRFCSDVQRAKALGMVPFIHDRRVIDVDLYKHRITTSIHGDLNKYVYSFDSSLKDVESENSLRKSVILNTDLLSIGLWSKVNED